MAERIPRQRAFADAGRSGRMRASGGYRELRSYQVATLVYDGTVRFCDRFVDKRSRTHDQMVQAARIAERQKRVQPAPPEPAAPTCPQCGKPMALRTARKGPRAGTEFWGCSGYPECRGTRSLD